MMPKERQREILNHLEKRLYMSVEELAKAVYASEPTIRRDLIRMEREGLIQRKRGGASFISQEKIKLPFGFRSHANIDRKNYLANLAAAYVEEGDCIFMDGSSTCYCLARHLADYSHLRVLTNGIPALQLMGSYGNILADCVCGTYHTDRACIYGHEACEYIAKHHARTCFISCCGVDIRQGVMEYLPEDAALKRAFHEHSERTILLADSSKMNQRSYYGVIPLKELSAIVTDQPLTDEMNEFCIEHQIEIVY